MSEPKKVFVLVVDDDESMVDLITMSLKHAGFQVEAALGGVEGCKKAKESKPDLIVLDLLMPDMHGFDVLQTLRNDPATKDIKVLVSSAKSYAVDQKSAERLGADGFIVKPYSTESLVQSVKKVLGDA